MADRFHVLQKALAAGMVAALVFSLLSPLVAFADTNLVIGGPAKIAYANGDNVRFRESVGYDGMVLGRYPEGTAVFVEDGPVNDADGNPWYQVTIGDKTGYILADYLALDSGAPLPVTEVAEEATTIVSAGEVIATAYIANSNGDGVRCRVEPSTSAAILMVVPEGDAVGLTGSPQGAWQPVECDGSAGFISIDFVSYDQPGGTAVITSDAGDVVVAAETTGSATVDANGDGLRCRVKADANSSILTVVADGAMVDLRGDVANGWQPVLCAGQAGFMSAQYLVYDIVDDNSGDGSGSAQTGEGVIDGTNGDGVRCRSGASFGASVITILAEGTTVGLRGAAEGGWQPVTCSGKDGFVSTDYVSTGGDDGGSSPGGDAVTGTATVVNSAGGLNCRSAASFSGGIIGYLPAGSTVELRGDAQGEWQPVYCSNKEGFAHTDYLSTGGTPDGDDTPGGGSNASFAAGDLVEVDGAGSTGVRLRTGASFDAGVLMLVAEGKQCTVQSGSIGDWVAVEYNGTAGFIHMDYLAAAGAGSDPGGNGDTSGEPVTDALGDGDHALVASDLRLRYEPNYNAGVAAVAPSGTVVLITGASSNGFYPVDWDGLSGYMNGGYLQVTDAALSERGGSGTPGNTDGGGSGDTGGSAMGNSLVNYAMQYVGYPYVWATHGPSSFDCSGFTYWVVKNVLGIDIGAGTWTQVSAGTPVSRSNLQPGDLVFFQNTYTFGLSHVGMYIGNDQFVHAENESTGVRVSSLSSSYYASRWYGAVRLV